jgi:hypothetical protein
MRFLVVVALAALLAGCGGAESQAVAACKAELASKMGDKAFAVDEADMAAKITKVGDNEFRIQSGLTIEPGMPREVKQTFDCRVRVDGDQAQVISLQIIW